jgi:hypothetical protein
MMKALVTLVRLLLLVVMVVMMLTGQAQASETCHAINAKGVGQDLGGGMTTAQIIGGGLLHGTTVGSFAITGMSGNVASIEGTVTFTTEDGTLTVNLKGTFDVAKGTFSASGPVNAGASTGGLAGATGTLSLNGVEDLKTGSFVETITGTICLSGR